MAEKCHKCGFGIVSEIDWAGVVPYHKNELDCINAQADEIKRLRSVLVQYADVGSLIMHWCGFASPDRVYYAWLGPGDGTDLARKALEATGGG